jgi:hypothetical protein
MAGPRRTSDSYKLLRQAIVDHVCLTATYQKRIRHFCPYALGWGNDGKEKVLALQYGGKSSKPISPDGEWRCFVVGDLRAIARNGDPWHVEQGSHSRHNPCVARVDVEVGTWRPG